MDTLGVIPKKPHTSKLAICSLFICIVEGLSVFGLFYSSSEPSYYVSKIIYGLLFSLFGYIFAFVEFLWLLSIAAIVLGILSLRNIHRQPDLLKGKGIAWLGIVFGGLMILAGIGYIWLMLQGG